MMISISALPMGRLSLLMLVCFMATCSSDIAWGANADPNSLAMIGVLCGFLTIMTGSLAKIIVAGALGIAAIGAVLGKISPATVAMLAVGGGCLIGAEQLAGYVSSWSGTETNITFRCSDLSSSGTSNPSGS